MDWEVDLLNSLLHSFHLTFRGMWIIAVAFTLTDLALPAMQVSLGLVSLRRLLVCIPGFTLSLMNGAGTVGTLPLVRPPLWVGNRVN